MKADILPGDCLEVLPTLPSSSVHCCVTSPPYFALRSYLNKDDPLKAQEIGCEPTPEAFVSTMVDVFREVRRVLHPSGLLFLNLSDSYSNSRNGGGGKYIAKGQLGKKRRASSSQLLNIPHRVSEALRGDGWLWRQTIVWAKTSPMPEPVNGPRWEKCNTPDCPNCSDNDGYILRKGKGRCTAAHEYIFVLAKTGDYFWDSAAFREPAVGGTSGNKTHKNATAYSDGDLHHRRSVGLVNIVAAKTRNPRSVWTISAEPSSVRHFAIYPSELVRRCIQAGTSDGGCCSNCLSPYAPMVETKQIKRERPNDHTATHNEGGGVNSCGNTVAGVDKVITGYRPVCVCRAEVSPCSVLDPFAGIGTTLQVARWMERDSIGIELNPKYIEHAKKRIEEDPRCEKNHPRKKLEHYPLFDGLAV